MKKLEESDLQIGDILIFENQDFDLIHFGKLLLEDKQKAAFYLLLYMIPWFDPGDDPKNYKNIYHAAIWGNVNIHRGENRSIENLNRIVQAGSHGISQASLDSTLKGPGVKNIYVYRFEDRDANFESKLNKQIRNFYDDVSIPYSYETAWLLAVICSMRYSDGAIYKMLKDKIGAWGADLMIGIIQDMINQYNDEHQKEMVACSTLVAMIYKDALYPLIIKDVVKDQPMHIPIDFDGVAEKLVIDEPKDKSLPKITIHETVVTPRQLFESKSVKVVGYLPFKGSTL